MTAQQAARGRDATEFWEIPEGGWRDILVRTWREAGQDNVGLLSAGVAFYSFVAFVPLLAAVVLIYGIVANPADVASHIDTLTRLLPADAAKIIADQLTSMTATKVSRTAMGLAVAIFFAIYGAMSGANAIIAALNITYGEHETRSLVRTYGLALGFTAGSVLVAIIASVAIGAMSLIGTVIRLPAAIGPLITVALWLGTALVASGLVAVVYRYGPNREHARWRWLTPGSLFASFGALLATFLFGLYVGHFNSYNATYGALGAVVSFLMWLYVAAYVVLLGAELNAEVEHQTARDTTSGPEQPRGSRGAKMADSVAASPPAEQPAPAAEDKPAEPSPVRRALATGYVASRGARIAGVEVGTLPMALVAGGIAMLGTRGRGKAGLGCIAAGAALAWRSARAHDAKGA